MNKIYQKARQEFDIFLIRHFSSRTRALYRSRKWRIRRAWCELWHSYNYVYFDSAPNIIYYCATCEQARIVNARDFSAHHPLRPMVRTNTVPWKYADIGRVSDARTSQYVSATPEGLTCVMDEYTVRRMLQGQSNLLTELGIKHERMADRV